MAATIAALATPLGAGGLCVVRLSGPDAAELLGRIVGRDVKAMAPRRVFYGVARDPVTRRRLDEVLYFRLAAPASYTGEEVAELQGHGGTANGTALLAALVAAGARLAHPGEFTRRAFLNGRMDLARAEAVAEVIGAEGERALSAAQARLAGGVGDAVRRLREGVIGLRAEIEALLDFPEERLETSPLATVALEAMALARQARLFAESARRGRGLQGGVTIALVGRTNVGKSSLLNALIGEERALVASEPGTTRDVVEARTTWQGVLVTMVDTAGEREGGGELEQQGMRLGRARAERADVRIAVLDAARPIDDWERALAARAELVALARCDLVAGRPAPVCGPRELVETSARTGDGIELLRRRALAVALGGAGAEGAGEEGLLVASERQRGLFASAAEALERSVTASGAELIALELVEAERRLGEILGEGVSEALLDTLFARFCIGK